MEPVVAGGRALFGGGVCIGGLVEDWGGVAGRGGSVDVGEGGILKIWLSSEGRRWAL